MIKVHSSIAATTLVVALSLTRSSALSGLPRQQHQRVDGSATAVGNGLFGKRSRGGITGGWITPSFRSSKFLFQSTKEMEEDPFFIVEEDDFDGDVAADEEGQQTWPVPPSEPISTPTPEPPALVLPDIKIAEKLDPLLNPTIAKAVPADTIRGAGIGGVLLALLTSFLFSGPFSVFSPGALVFSASVGIISSYISITEGAAGDFARSAGSITIKLTDNVAGSVEGWQAEKEVGRIADALLTPPPPPEAARAAATRRAAEEAKEAEQRRLEEELAENALRKRMRAEEEARAAEEARLQAEEDARWRAEEEALARAAAAAKEEEVWRLAKEEASRARAEEEARLRAEEEARELAKAEEARRMENQAAAAREGVRLMEEQEALAEDKDEEDAYMEDEDWEASVRLADQLRGIEGDWASDDLLQMEMDELSAEEEDALGKAAREAVRKYEAEMAAKPTPPIAQEPINRIEEEEAEEIEYSKMTVVQLKNVLRSKGLKVSGKKAVLIERLMESS